MRTVRARLTLFTILVVALALGLTGLALRARIRQNLIDEVDRQLAQQIAHVTTGASVGDLDIPVIRHEAPPKHAAGEIHNRMVQVLKTGRNLVKLDIEPPSPRIIPVRPDGSLGDEMTIDDPDGAKEALSRGRTFRTVTKGGVPMRTVSAPVGDHVAVVQAVLPMSPVYRQLADLDRGLLMSIPFAILIAAVSGALLIGSSMRPIRQLTDSARRLDPGLSDERLPADGHDEFAAMARVLNEAFDRTASAFQAQREAIAHLQRFTADAGHELRTPLATIKGSSSYLLHMTDLPSETVASVQSIDRSADRMARLIDDLLILARHDSGTMPLRRQSCDVGLLVQEVVDETSPPPHLRVETCLKVDGPFAGDPDFIHRVLTNLLANACQYARSSVRVDAVLEEGVLTLAVTDDGEGIAPEHLARLGERFYRPDPARARTDGGFGLGLAIVKELCAAHGGALRIESELGVGTTVRASFRSD